MAGLIINDRNRDFSPMGQSFRWNHFEITFFKIFEWLINWFGFKFCEKSKFNTHLVFNIESNQLFTEYSRIESLIHSFIWQKRDLYSVFEK